MIDPRYSVTGSGVGLSEKQKQLIALADSTPGNAVSRSVNCR